MNATVFMCNILRGPSWMQLGPLFTEPVIQLGELGRGVDGTMILQAKQPVDVFMS